MGAVFLARRPGQEPVALKLLLHHSDPGLLARFDREAKILRSLNSLGIVRLLDYGLDQGRPYIVQEFCSGGDLAGLLHTRGRLPPEEARDLVIALSAALEVAHRAGIVHRDLKPANVLLVDGQPKLTDFGLARAKGIDRASLTETGVFLGTPHYMAPEQLLDAREVDQRSDVYALGVILYELVSGNLPFQGATAIAIADAVLCEPARPLPTDVPLPLRDVIARAMAREPGERYDSAQDLADDLTLLSAPPPPAGSPALLTALAVLIGILIVTVAALFAFSRSPLEVASSPASTSPSLPEASLSPALPSAATPSPSLPEASKSPLAARPPTSSLVSKSLEDCLNPVTLEQGVAALAAEAKRGNPEAALAYGRLLLTGYGVPLNQGLAEEQIRIAARAGNPEAIALQALCHPPDQWAIRHMKAQRKLIERGVAGDEAALVFLISNMDQLPPRLLRAIAKRAEAPGPIRDLRAPNRISRSKRGSEQLALLQELRGSLTPEAFWVRASLAGGATLKGLPSQFEEDIPSLLEKSFAGGVLPAATSLGRWLCKRGQPGDVARGRRWLERAALHGRGEAAFLRWQQERSDLPWLQTAARLGHLPAAGALGKILLEKSLGEEARPWLELAVTTSEEAHPRTLLAVLLREDNPARALELSRAGAATGDRNGLGVYAELLFETRAAEPARRLKALEILGGLACLGQGPAAMRAARIARELQLSADVVRSLLRRAYLDPATRPRARSALEFETREVPSTAPVRSQSQLLLLERAKAGDREALVEIGRRADLEAQGEDRYRAVQAAAETGDLQSRLNLANLHAASGHPHSDRARALAEFEQIGRDGFPEAWVFAFQLGPSMKVLGRGALLRRLEKAAASKEPRALFALGLALCRDPRTAARAMAILREAKDKGLEAAFDLLFRLESQTPQGEEALEGLRRDPGRHQTTLGMALLQRAREPREFKAARKHLLLAALGGAPSHVLFALGKTLSQSPPPGLSTATVWWEAAGRAGFPRARLHLGRLYLEMPAFERHEEAFALLDQLAREEDMPRAKLLVGMASLRGQGTPVNLQRAERELKAAAAQLDEARSILGEVYLAQGRGAKARALWERELEKGSSRARVSLAESLLKGSGGPQNLNRGLALLEEGIRLGEARSANRLADMYQRGLFVPKNSETARKLREAARQANAPRQPPR